MTDLEIVPDDEPVATVVKDPCCQCVLCKVQTCKSEDGAEWLYNGSTGETDRVCPACDLAVWQCNVTIQIAHGLPAWVTARLKSRTVLDRLKQWFRTGARCQVFVFSRRETETLRWQYHWNAWDHTKPPRKPYSYRGYCGSGVIVLIVDELGIETPDSLEWLLYHELGHHEQQTRAQMSDAAWYAENTNEGRTGYDWESDAGHEADSEERHVNRVATAFMGGREYARYWWRPRVNAALAGSTLLPDPYAPSGSEAYRMSLGKATAAAA